MKQNNKKKAMDFEAKSKLIVSLFYGHLLLTVIFLFHSYFSMKKVFNVEY